MKLKVLFIIADGFSSEGGKGIRDMAAVSIVAPLMMLITGIGLMFGTEGSVPDSINIFRGKPAIADITITQSTVDCSAVTTNLTPLILLFPQRFVSLFWVGRGTVV